MTEPKGVSFSYQAVDSLVGVSGSATVTIRDPNRTRLGSNGVMV